MDSYGKVLEWLRSPDANDAISEAWGERPGYVDWHKTLELFLGGKPKLCEAILTVPGRATAALCRGARTGLPWGDAEGYLTLQDRKGKDGDRWVIKDIALDVGYKGMVRLALEAGIVIDGDVVFQGDLFEVQRGSQSLLIHKPRYGQPRGKDNAIAAWAIGRWKGGERFEVLDPERIKVAEDASRKQNRGRDGEQRETFWDTAWQAAWIKTAVRALYKWLPRSSAMDAVMGETQAADEPSGTATLDPAARAVTYDVEVEPEVSRVPTETPE